MLTNSRTTIASVLVMALLAGCAGDKPKQSQAPSAAPAPTPMMVQKPASPTPVPRPVVPVAPTPVRVNPLNDPSNILARRSIYYDFDRSDITAEFRSLIEAHAHYLHDHPGARITIQGNCDERGSREYNIALGQRRAEGVRQLLKLLGAVDAQIEAVSFGEEKPKALGHDEAAWAENRRSDIVYERPE